MLSVGRFFNFLWDGLTLKFVTEKEIISYYKWFMVCAFVLEAYLAVLFTYTLYLEFHFDYGPEFLLLLCGAVLLGTVVITVLLIKSLVKRKC
ncbi:hypothetical protein [Peribacillus kribbensis]|uniref:hypothetical protein n=1 Tax=Peribacillus kribbensis TaxID=356658 RepID=UPI0003FB7B7D|nr:hypothetical protein [Peribacillus kribbensis]